MKSRAESRGHAPWGTAPGRILCGVSGMLTNPLGRAQGGRPQRRGEGTSGEGAGEGWLSCLSPVCGEVGPRGRVRWGTGGWAPRARGF